MEWINTMHLMVPPPEYALLDRFLITRDPYDRLVSIYNFLRRNRSQWGSDEIQGFTFSQFVTWFARKRKEYMDDPKLTSRRAPWLWLMNCWENWNLMLSVPGRLMPGMTNCLAWKLEEANDLLAMLKDVYEIPTHRDTMYRGNTADSVRGEKGSSWKIGKYYSSRKTLNTVNEMWAAEDCKKFFYPLKG